MSKITQAFNKGKPLIVFIMAGDPTLTATEQTVLELVKAGADIIEIGIPFSDSIADGPVIVEAASRGIKSGAGAKEAIGLVEKLRERTDVPIVFMTSIQILNSYGIEKFINDSSYAGVNGFILPDLPIDEARQTVEKARSKKIDIIFLVAPNTPEKRIKQISDLSGGFVYLVSTTGTTGIRKELSSSVRRNVNKIKKYTQKPVAVGFGVSTPEQAREAVKYADGVIVGSAVVKLLNEDINKAIKLVTAMKKAIR